MADGERARAGPVAWPEVVATYGPEYDENVELFDSLLERLDQATPPRYAGGQLGGYADTVAAIAVLRGPESAAPLIERVAGALPRVASQLSPVIPEPARLAGAYTIAFLNAARCCGVAPGVDAPALEARWLAQLTAHAAQLTDPERHTLALAASAASIPSAVVAFADLPRLAGFAPGATHGFDLPAFAGHLASAVEQGASYQDVEPAWLDFVHRFPYKLDTGMLGWPALLFAARAVYATIGKLPEHEVALELHRLVAGT